MASLGFCKIHSPPPRLTVTSHCVARCAVAEPASSRPSGKCDCSWVRVKDARWNAEGSGLYRKVLLLARMTTDLQSSSFSGDVCLISIKSSHPHYRICLASTIVSRHARGVDACVLCHESANDCMAWHQTLQLCSHQRLCKRLMRAVSQLPTFLSILFLQFAVCGCDFQGSLP
jgi:hypothetical protein